MTKDPIEKLRDIASELDDCAASMSEHGWSPVSTKIQMAIQEIEARYLKLPLDADGVPIKPGDILKSKQNGIIYDVEAVAEDEVALKHVPWIHASNLFYHKKPDTIESLLEELVLREDLGILSMEAEREEMDALLEQYAERIRKVVQDG